MPSAIAIAKTVITPTIGEIEKEHPSDFNSFACTSRDLVNNALAALALEALVADGSLDCEGANDGLKLGCGEGRTEIEGIRLGSDDTAAVPFRTLVALADG